LVITEFSTELREDELRNEELHEAVLQEALAGLAKPSGQQKTLSPWLFYDELGSQLFEQITELPEYYLTRTERSIFAQHGPSLPTHLKRNVTIAELGAGTATKTGLLLREFVASQGDVLYQPIDISPTALEEASASIRASIPGVGVEPQVANYITEKYEIARPVHHLVLALYIGSSIGNFSPEEARGILRNLRSHLNAGDALLLGTDKAPGESKTVRVLEAAYDDAAGVTAAFNINVLTRLNRELDADFDLDAFAHEARWNAEESRMEMHLVSRVPQTVTVAGKKIMFAKGETIHTENSYKFTDQSLAALLADSGFAVDLTMHDPAKYFAVTLARAI
jgi:L-histidine N-alpha-methyltransferase